MRIVFVSDTHEEHSRIVIPRADVLVHAGDFTMSGKPKRVAEFDAWIASLKAGKTIREAVVIAGNHEMSFEDPARRPQVLPLLKSCRYLEDSGCEIDGVRFWGSPWQPEFHEWAFNLPRGEALAKKWAAIPADVQILITHGPPHGILDRTYDGRDVGCEELLKRLDSISPRVHVFGHIHEGYGAIERGKTRLINASICDAGYNPVNAPVVVDI